MMFNILLGLPLCVAAKHQIVACHSILRLAKRSPGCSLTRRPITKPLGGSVCTLTTGIRTKLHHHHHNS